MENKAIATRTSRPVLIGVLLVTTLLITACGGGDDEPAPEPQTQSTGPGPLDQGGIVCELAAILFGGECVGIGNTPNCSDDPFNNPLGLPDCGDTANSRPPNSGPWPKPPTEFTVSAPTNSTITLDWIPPTTYTDGSTLTTIDGYVIRWTMFPDDDWLTADYVYVQNPGLTSYVMDLPSPGVWYLMIFTHADGGKGGPPSDMVNVEIM